MRRACESSQRIWPKHPVGKARPGSSRRGANGKPIRVPRRGNGDGWEVRPWSVFACQVRKSHQGEGRAREGWGGLEALLCDNFGVSGWCYLEPSPVTVLTRARIGHAPSGHAGGKSDGDSYDRSLRTSVVRTGRGSANYRCGSGIRILCIHPWLRVQNSQTAPVGEEAKKIG